MSPLETAEAPVLVKTSPISKWAPIAQDTPEEASTTKKEAETVSPAAMDDPTILLSPTVEEEAVVEEVPSATSIPEVAPELPPKNSTPEADAELRTESETFVAELPQTQDLAAGATSKRSIETSSLRACVEKERLARLKRARVRAGKRSTLRQSCHSGGDKLSEFSGAAEESDGSSSSSSFFASSGSTRPRPYPFIPGMPCPHLGIYHLGPLGPLTPGTGPFHIERSGWVPDHPQVRPLQLPHTPITHRAPSPGPIPCNPPPIVLRGNPLLPPLSQCGPLYPPALGQSGTSGTITGSKAHPNPPAHTLNTGFTNPYAPLLPRPTISSLKGPDYWIFGPRYGIPEGPFLDYYGYDDDGVDVYLDSSQDFEGIARKLSEEKEDGEGFTFHRDDEEEEEILIFYNPYDEYHCERVQQSGSPSELLHFNYIWDEGFKDALDKGWREGYAAGHAYSYNQGWLIQSTDFVEGFMSTRALNDTARPGRAPIGSYPKGYLTEQEVYDEGWEDGYRKRWFEGWDSGRRDGSEDKKQRDRLVRDSWASVSTQMMDYDSDEDDISLASTVRLDPEDDDSRTVRSKQSRSTSGYAAEAVLGGWEAYSRLIRVVAALGEEMNKRYPLARRAPSPGPSNDDGSLNSMRYVGNGGYVSANPLVHYPSDDSENEAWSTPSSPAYGMDGWGSSYFRNGRRGLVSD